MTGELYALLVEHSILGRLAAPGEATTRRSRAACATAFAHDAALAHDLFSARTLALTDRLAPSGVGDYLSGLLLGAEIAAARRWLERMRMLAHCALTLVGAQALVHRYRARTGDRRDRRGRRGRRRRGARPVAHCAARGTACDDDDCFARLSDPAAAGRRAARHHDLPRSTPSDRRSPSTAFAFSKCR